MNKPNITTKIAEYDRKTGFYRCGKCSCTFANLDDLSEHNLQAHDRPEENSP